MISHIRQRLRRDNGQSLVEFTLVIPVILLVVLGFVDFGLAYNYKNDETSLANQAARFAVVNTCAPCAAGSGQSIESYVKSTADDNNLQNGGSGFGIQTPGVTVTFCAMKSGYAVGDPLSIGDTLRANVTARYEFLPWLGSTFTLTATATQRVESPYSGPGYSPGGDQYTVTGPCPP
jgi:Flp pilus assembly protein TadG